MQLYNRVIVISVLVFLISSCDRQDNDLVDYGYHGEIRKVILASYLNPNQSSGEWQADKEPGFTKTTTFNGDGMVTEESFVSQDKSYIKKFILEGDKTVEYSQTGDDSGHSNYTYANSSRMEKHYDSAGILQYEVRILFNKKKLTTKEEYKYYNDNKNITGHTTIYYIDRVDGYVNKFVVHDSINKKRSFYENIILSKDDKSNPTKILRKKDGLPESLRVLKFEYN